MYKHDSHDSSVEYYTHDERPIKNSRLSQARLARRQNRTNSAITTTDEITDPEVSSRSRVSRRQRRSPPSEPALPPPDYSTTVSTENETRPARKKKTFKTREGEEIEMTVKKRDGSRRRRARTKPKESQSESEAQIDPDRDKILGITIHRTDRLKTDLRLRHPFVRVHLIDVNTQSYVRKTDPNHLVFRFHSQNEQPSDHILSISTQSYDFSSNRSTIPAWEELLVFDESYSRFTRSEELNIYVFFEILEFFNDAKTPNDPSNSFPIAWAFLKVLGSHDILNTEKMLRLQLWQPIEQQRSSIPLTPDVFTWFNQAYREKYPSTLYVTIKPLNSPSHFRSGLRSGLEGDIENIRDEYRQLNRDLGEQFDNPSRQFTDTEQLDVNNQAMGPLQRVAQLPPRWRKLPNSKCKIPSEPLLSLNTSERGCSSIRFSHNGYFLACADVNKSEKNNLISIFEIPRGQRVTIFTGHLNMIYDLDWSRTDHYLASASADSSVKLWNFEHIQRKPWRSLAHPNYVYCVRFHPLAEDIIVTAGYDKLIRIWNTERKHGNIIRTMGDHSGFISSLSFNPDGTRLASVDSIGSIKIWHGLSNERIYTDSWSLELNIDFDEFRNIPLNSVIYAPGDNYILVSARDSLIVLIDVRTKTISRRYTGGYNLQDRIRSTFSTCGTLVFSGSEDGQVHCWHAYNGNLLYSYKNLNYIQPVLDIQFHPCDNLLAMCSIGTMHQVYVFQHTFQDADIEAKPLPGQTIIKDRPASVITTSMKLSDNELRPSTGMRNQHDYSAKYTTGSDTDQNTRRGRADSSDELPRTTATFSDDARRNRRLAVVNKILGDMDDVINPKAGTNRHQDSITNYGGGHLMSRSTERDVSPYQGRRNISMSGYNSDSGRPPIVSPLRNLTSPDLFVPASDKIDDDDVGDNDHKHRHSPASSNRIMYATTNYKAQRPEELSFSKNDKIKILNKESHLLWHAEHIQTGVRGYVSPNRVHIKAKETYSQFPTSNANVHSISEIPRLDSSSRRLHRKSVKFDSSD